MTLADNRIVELSRNARDLLASSRDFLRVLISDETDVRQQRRAIIIAALRDYESRGNVGIALEELAADVEAVLRLREDAIPDDLVAECADLLRQMEGWNTIDSAIAPDRARYNGGLRRRVERDYSLARPLRVFLPHWDAIQRDLRRRFVSLSANYFAQAASAFDMLLHELRKQHPDSLHCFTAWQTAAQSLHGVNRESHDFARELRSIVVDPNHPEMLAEIADRLSILYDKFYRVAHEGALAVRERLVTLRDVAHDGANIALLLDALRRREDEWSVGLGETEGEREERIAAIASDILRDLAIFEQLVQDSGHGSWREGMRAISLALVDLTERIHAAIALRLQQTQAIEALTRHARMLAEGGENEAQRTRAWLWNASGAVHAALWIQGSPSADESVMLERWLENKGGSALPLVDDETWVRSFMPRKKTAPPLPPPPLQTDDNWDPGEDLTLKHKEEAREALVQRLLAAGSAANIQQLYSFDELRMLAQLLWLPRDSAPLRRLGIKIAPPVVRGPQRAVIHGPGFEIDLENYRFLSLKSIVEPVAAPKIEHLVTHQLQDGQAALPDRRASRIAKSQRAPDSTVVTGDVEPVAEQPPAQTNVRRTWPFASRVAGQRGSPAAKQPFQEPDDASAPDRDT